MSNLLLAKSGIPLLAVAGRPLLFASSGGGGNPGGGGGGTLSDIADLNGWWDASGLGTGTGVSLVSDASAGARDMGASGAAGVPRLSGLLAGLGQARGPQSYGMRIPWLVSANYAVSGVPVGSDGSFTVFLVWSRPNLPQVSPSANNDPVFSTTPTPLVAINGTTIVDMTVNGDGADTLRLFPAGTPVTAGALELRHTHSLRLVFSTAGVDLWLDGTKIVTAATNQSGALSGNVSLAFLTNAQLYFHEAATWPRALGGADHIALTSYAARWALGPRMAANVLMMGQSNANEWWQGSDSLFLTLGNALQYWTGRLAANVPNPSNSGGTCQWSGSQFFTPNTDSSLFLNNTGNDDPSGWAYGTLGSQFVAYIGAMRADDVANIRAIAWVWSESDTLFLSYANKAIYEAALRRAFALIRGTLGRTAAQLPVLVINALPFTLGSGGNATFQMHREVMQDLVDDASQNVEWLLTQTDDAIGEGDSWDATTGQESGPGNGAHRDQNGFTNFTSRAVICLAKTILAADLSLGKSEPISAFAAGLPSGVGPSIASAHYEGTAEAATGSILVTIQHDAGTDLKLPRKAAQGVGWAVMDGGTVTSPGTLVAATACARVSATQLRLTLAQTLANAGSAHLYYVYGGGLDSSSYASIGQGNAVTDNWSNATPTDGWDVTLVMGSSFQPDLPLQATTYGIQMT